MTRMTMMTGRGVLAAALCAGALFARPDAAAAQQICVGRPRNVPSLHGTPRWLTADTTVTSDVSALLNDPRWANAARQPHQGDSANTSFRVAYDANFLLVSFETTTADQRDPIDAVYFGISDGASANAVKIHLPDVLTSVAENAPEAYVTDQAFWFQSMRAADVSKVTTAASNFGWTINAADDAAPNWIVSPAAWVRQKNGGWGVNFKVDLTKLGATYQAGSKPRLYFGTMVNNSVGFTAYQTPEPTGLGVISDNAIAVIPRMVSEWPQTAEALGTSCVGITLPKTTIGIERQDEDYRILGTFMPKNVGLIQHLEAAPTWPNPAYDAVNNPTVPQTLTIGDSTIAAKFRLANWGSQATLDAWTPLLDHDPTSGAERSLIPVSGSKLTLRCRANTGTESCGVPLSELADPNNTGESHQCMLVEMSKLTTDPSVRFSDSSEYRNLTFDHASTIQRVATLNVKGLQAKFGNTNSRDVYLFVERTNMPAAGQTLLPELPRSDMSLARLAATGEAKCPNSQNSCQAYCPDGVCQGYACAQACSNPAATNPCPNGRRLPGAGCYCIPSEGYDACLPDSVVNPAGADVPAQSTEQSLAKVWPYYHVRAFYDTGKRFTINGTSRIQLKPMPDFGLMIDHQGAYYGFSDSLSLIASNGVTFANVAPDVYRVRIPNEGKAQVMVTVTANEQAIDTPLCTITGASSTFGIFGSVTLVQVSSSNQPLNLAKASAQINELVYEPNNRELASNLGTPTTLTRLPGALPGAASFAKSSLFGPTVNMDVLELPLIGRVITTNATGLNVLRPSTCNLLGGIATLETKFTYKDGTNPPLVTSGRNVWACAPLSMLTF